MDIENRIGTAKLNDTPFRISYRDMRSIDQISIPDGVHAQVALTISPKAIQIIAMPSRS